jgi:hypothetical protein
MNLLHLRRCLTFACVLVLAGCATTTEEHGGGVPAQPAAPTTTQPAPTPPEQPPPASGQALSNGGQAETLIKKGDILVTQEEYQKTLDDVQALIRTLNQEIARQDYDAWLSHLTDGYRSYYSDPKTLDQVSSQPLLRRQNVQLHSLEDYFLDVVVPSRANAHVDDIDFVDKDHVKAITIISGARYILYDLQRQGDSWEIALSS